MQGFLPHLYPLQYEPTVRRALEEDLGRAGDLTTQAVVPLDSKTSGRLVAREAGSIAGLDITISTFRMLDPRSEVELSVEDGESVEAGAVLAVVKGSTRAILSAERVALNFMGRLSGIATATAKMVEAIGGYPARVTCTRKTTPGLRALEKYAVRAGGGVNHRFGLDDGVLIKDNHLAMVANVAEAVDRVRGSVGHMVKVQVEVDNLEQLEEALACRVDAVLLDNMDPPRLREAVTKVAERLITEASGNIDLTNAREVASTGVHLLSAGWLTHSAPALDLALEIETERA